MPFWRDPPSLSQHVDQHRRPEAREWIVPMNVGDKSASFEATLFIPPHDLLILRRVYLCQPSALAASSSAFWTLAVVQRIEGKDHTLATFDGARYGLAADTPFPLDAEDAPLAGEWPVLLVGVKAGSPSNLDDLHLTAVLALG